MEFTKGKQYKSRDAHKIMCDQLNQNLVDAYQ